MKIDYYDRNGKLTTISYVWLISFQNDTLKGYQLIARNMYGNIIEIIPLSNVIKIS